MLARYESILHDLSPAENQIKMAAPSINSENLLEIF